MREQLSPPTWISILFQSNHLQSEAVNVAVASDWAQTQVQACPLAVFFCGQDGHPREFIHGKLEVLQDNTSLYHIRLKGTCALMKNLLAFWISSAKFSYLYLSAKKYKR